MASKWHFSKKTALIEHDNLEATFFNGSRERKIKISADLLRSAMKLGEEATLPVVDEVAYHFFLHPEILQHGENPNCGKAVKSNNKLIMTAINSFLSKHKNINDEQLPILSFENIDHYLEQDEGFAKAKINSNFHKNKIEIR